MRRVCYRVPKGTVGDDRRIGPVVDGYVQVAGDVTVPASESGIDLFSPHRGVSFTQTRQVFQVCLEPARERRGP